MSHTFTKRPRLSPKASREKLIEDIHSLIKTLREIFKNNRKLSSSIDEAYEYLLEDQIRLIPNDWICGAYETCDMLKGIIMCFDFIGLNKVIQTRASKVWFRMDCYDFIINDMFRALTDQGNTRAVLENLMQVFKPLCNCIDYIFMHPEEFVQRLADVCGKTKENGDIF
jgi:hypothetical protein